MPRTLLERIQPAPLDGGFRDNDYWIWCGSVIQGDDGLFHMFASMWSKKTPFAPNWLTHSRIVRATSTTAEGPYTYVEDVIAPRGPEFWDGCMSYNPTIHKYGDKYLLFYTGSTYHRELGPNGEVSQELRTEARGNQRIGIAVATSPSGPWQRPDAPCLDVRPGHWDSFLTTNPAPCVLPDSQIHLMYKSTPSNSSPIQYGVAHAASWDSPFERVGPDEPITFGKTNIPYEDAYLWYADGMYQMIFNDLRGAFTGEDHAGAHAISEDGIDWKLAPQPKAYSRTLTWDDGSVTHQGWFERPQLLIQDGVPTHLFAATADGPGGFSKADNTWNMVVPIGD